MKHLLKTGLRSIIREKGYTLLNVLGMALGLTIALIIIHYVLFHVSFDRNISDYENVYRVYVKQPGNIFMGKDEFNVVPNPLAPELNKIPGVESWSRLGLMPMSIKPRENEKIETFPYWIEADFPKLFPVKVVQGSLEGIHTEPNRLALTESMAEQIFGNTSVVGQQVAFYGVKDLYTVAAVVEDFPANSHLQSDVLFSYTEMENLYADENWESNSTTSYLRTRPDANISEIEAAITKLVQSHKEEQSTDTYHLQPAYRIHLFGDINFEIGQNLETKVLYLFGSIALGILLISVFNYINLSTARAQRREKEVRVKKINGGGRGMLVIQFLTESYMLTFVAFILALLLMEALLPFVTERLFSGTLPVHRSSQFWWLVLLLFGTTGLAAGMYPSWYITSGAVRQVSWKDTSAKEKGRVRDGLVVFQFVITTFLIGLVVFFARQMSFMQTKDLGYEKENIVVYELNKFGSRNFPGIKHEIEELEGIVDITGSRDLPCRIGRKRGMKMPTDDGPQSINLYMLSADANFASFYGIDILEGRNLMAGHPADSAGAILLNKTAVERFRMEDPLSLSIGRGSQQYQVVGVTGDYNFTSLHQGINPAAIVLATSNEDFFNLSVKLPANSDRSVLSKVDDIVRRYSDNLPVQRNDFQFYLDRYYTSEKQLNTQLIVLTCFAILIACLGLVGLSSYLAFRRKKEMAVRKVLGASPRVIYRLMNVRFLVLILLANALALPLCWYFVNQWLTRYEYRIELSWYVFALVVLASIVVSVLTVAFQVYKTMKVNPAEVIRNE